MKDYLKIDGVIYLPDSTKKDIYKRKYTYNNITENIIKLVKEEGFEAIIHSSIIINDESGEFSPYSIYKHFKGDYYATIDKSNPISSIRLDNLLKESNKDDDIKSLTVQHTESEQLFNIYLIDGKWYHNNLFDKKELSIYKSLYDNEITYARPLDMFLSTVDKNKYPDVNQQYRFEKQ